VLAFCGLVAGLILIIVGPTSRIGTGALGMDRLDPPDRDVAVTWGTSNSPQDFPAPAETRLAGGSPTSDPEASKYAKYFDPSIDLEFFVSQRKGAILSGNVTREDIGQEYDRVIRGIWRERVTGLSTGMTEARTALFCGYKTLKEIHAARDDREPRYVATRALLVDLLSAAEQASNSVNEYVEECWESGVGVDTWPKGTSAPTNTAWDTDPATPRVSLLRFSTSVTVGDTVFGLKFKSAHFPQLESALTALKLKKEAYWMTLRSF